MTRARDLSRHVNNRMRVFKYTATAGQLTFTDSDDVGTVLSYDPNALMVTYNGVVLEQGSEYTADNGTSIVLADSADLDAEVNVIAFDNLDYSGVLPTTGGILTGDLTVNAALNVQKGIVVAGDPNYPDTDEGGGIILRAGQNWDKQFGIDNFMGSMRFIREDDGTNTNGAELLSIDSAGGVVLKGKIDGSTAPLNVSVTSIPGGPGNVFMRGAKILDAGMTASNHRVLMQIGKSDGSMNTAQFGFAFQGGADGDTDNYAFVSMHSKDDIIQADGNGAVRMKYQPAFKAGMNANTFTTGLGSAQIIYDYVMFDRTSSYSTSTGRYTCPVDGVYYFTHSVSARTTYAGTYEVKIFQNGVERVRQFHSAESTDEHGANVSLEIECNANDYIEARGYWAGGITFSGNLDMSSSPSQGVLSFFSGHLIG